MTTSGTLTLVLANRNGFVIGSDSRQSSSQKFVCAGVASFFCDNSQKLFKSGKKSAVAISGFSAGFQGTNLQLEVASVLRRRYKYLSLPNSTEKAWTPPMGAKPGMTIMSMYVTGFKGGGRPGSESYVDRELQEALTTVAALAGPNAGSSLSLTTLVAEIDKKGLPQVRRIDYRYSPHLGGPLNIALPDYDVEDVSSSECSKIQGKKPHDFFLSCTAGLDAPAKKILSGSYNTNNKILKDYQNAFRKRALHKWSLAKLKAVIEQIQLITSQSNEAKSFPGSPDEFSVVGGPTQIGVFPATRESTCCSNLILPKDEQILPSKFIREGLLYSGTSDGSPVNSPAISFYWGGQYDPEKTITQVFIGNYFRNVTLRLKDNYFISNLFEGVTFDVGDGECVIPYNSVTILGCAYFGPIQLPRSCSQLLTHCSRAYSLPNQPTVGEPLKMTISKCHEQHEDGSVTLWIGGECGDKAGLTGFPIK